MTKKEIQKKIESCKALQGVTIADVVAMQRFGENLAAYMTAQREDRNAIRKSYEAMRKLGGTRGYKLPSHPIDRLMNLDVASFATEYMRVVAKVSDRPAAEREYIWQLGQQAYNLTIAQIVCEEYPELHDYFFPEAN